LVGVSRLLTVITVPSNPIYALFFMLECLVSLSLSTWKRPCYVPHNYKKSPSDLSLTLRFWALPCTFPQVLGSQKISSLSFHKFVLLVLLIAQRRNNDALNYAWCLTTWRVAESFMCPIPGEFAIMNWAQHSSTLHWYCAWSLLSLHDYMCVLATKIDLLFFSNFLNS
jgi:hypothetical protein